MLKRATYVFGSLFLAFALFWIWFGIASNYDYDALAGTYGFNGGKVSALLILKADQTFTEELTADGQKKYAHGTWHRSGEAGVDFSGTFIRLPGQRSFSNTPGSEHTPANDEFYGHFEKILTVYPKLSLDGGTKEIKLYKKLFR